MKLIVIFSIFNEIYTNITVIYTNITILIFIKRKYIITS